MALKNKIEALLFSSGRRMSIEEISKLCKRRQDEGEVLSALEELKKEYEQKDSSLMIIDEGNFWKITVKEEHLPLVKNIVTETELSKTLMETLAVIALRYPIKQSDLIKIRTNKAYDHLNELEEMGYITRQKYGRTKLIKLSEKFFEYFSLAEEQLKEKFKDFGSLAKAIEEKETEFEKQRAELKKKAAEEKKKGEVNEKEIDLFDKDGNRVKLDVIDEKPIPEELPKTVEDKDKLDSLEVVDEKSWEEVEEDRRKEEAEQKKHEDPEELKDSEEEPKDEENVDKIVENMLTTPADEEEPDTDSESKEDLEESPEETEEADEEEKEESKEEPVEDAEEETGKEREEGDEEEQEEEKTETEEEKQEEIEDEDIEEELWPKKEKKPDNKEESSEDIEDESPVDSEENEDTTDDTEEKEKD